MSVAAHGIPTAYRSTQFRSRLEARWAAFFDLIDWRWTYEPLDADGYIPDFLISGPQPFLVEIGPCVTEADYRSKADKPLTYSVLPTLILGVTPFPMFAGDTSYSGYLVNESPGIAERSFWTRGVNGWSVFQDADWHYPTGEAWATVRHLGGLDEVEIEEMWRQAGNAVQWKRR